MSLQVDNQNKTGLYMGTEIDKKWWKRYRENGFFARGNGQYSYDNRAFYFYKYPQDKPMTIPLDSIVDFEIGRWHAGKWSAGLPVMKIVWVNDSNLLSSGFILSRNIDETERIISELKHIQKR